MLLAFAFCFFAFISLAPSSLFADRNDEDSGPASQSSAEKVDTEKFVGSWKESDSRIMFGALDVRDILTKSIGDHLKPEKKGAVLTAASKLSFGLLKSDTTTKKTEFHGEQMILYINTGTGVITTETGTADLREGIGVLIPEGVEFTLSSASDSPLTMYMITEPVPPGFVPRKSIVVRDEFDNRISSNVQRTPAHEWLFNQMDGLATIGGINVIMFEPKTYVPPHSHFEGDEEIWLVLRGNLKFQLGPLFSTLQAGSGYKVPADNKTPHTNVNADSTSVKTLWIMSVSEM